MLKDWKYREQILNEEISKYQQECLNTPKYSYLNTKRYGYSKINQHFNGRDVLELGSDGAATSSILVRWSEKLTIVDRADKFSHLIQKDPLLKQITFIQSLWQDYKPKSLFSDIFLTDSLEHVENPVELLKIIKNWLAEDGKLHIIVPNALSIHRMLGVEMGYLTSPYELNENDIGSGHVKVYDSTTLKKEVRSAGLNIITCEGIQLKPNTDTQLLNLGDKFSDALNNLSYLFNDHCAEIYICCSK